MPKCFQDGAPEPSKSFKFYLFSLNICGKHVKFACIEKHLRLWHHNYWRYTNGLSYEWVICLSRFKSRLRNTLSKLPRNYSTQQSSEKSFYLFPRSSSECGKIITTLRNTKEDIGIISVRLVKKFINYIAEPLTYIISKFFTLGAFPDHLKIARGTPILKKRRVYKPI